MSINCLIALVTIVWLIIGFVVLKLPGHICCPIGLGITMVLAVLNWKMSLVSVFTAALEGVLAHREEIDQKIGAKAKGWSLDRMSLVDLTILRLAVWEILYAEDVPGSVSVSEALELTEYYSDPGDKPFVNGILGSILREQEDQA